MGMQWSRMKEYNLWGFHGVMLREIHLKLVCFIGIKSSRSSTHFNNPSLEIVGDFVLETDRRVDLPLHQLFLEPIARNLTQCLAGGGGGAGHALNLRWRSSYRESRKERESQRGAVSLDQ
uniref:Putative ubiquitin-conjugating enzyme E2 16 n=2 Tax=Rhizophora mucronata TaxID=61149 RepID=A0A2P2LDS5_RHIMU